MPDLTATSGSKPILEVNQLDVDVNNYPLLRNFSLQLLNGQHLELLGGNGSGKTTLIRHIVGIRRSPVGQVVRHGELTYVGQNLGLNLSLTPLENLRWFSGLSANPVDDENICEAMEQMGVLSLVDSRVGSLSSGQQKRCALTRLLLAPNSTWVLDEPLTFLDAEAIAIVRQLVMDHLQNANASLIATHASLGIEGTVSIDIDLM